MRLAVSKHADSDVVNDFHEWVPASSSRYAESTRTFRRPRRYRKQPTAINGLQKSTVGKKRNLVDCGLQWRIPETLTRVC